MKLKFTREKEVWPETEYFERLRNKGWQPNFHVNCEILQEKDAQLADLSNEKQYMHAQLRDDVSSEREAARIMRAVEDVMSGRESKWNATGNAWTVALDLNGAVFEYAIMDGTPGGEWICIPIFRLWRLGDHSLAMKSALRDSLNCRIEC